MASTHEHSAPRGRQRVRRYARERVQERSGAGRKEGASPSDLFRKLAVEASSKLGSHWAFLAAVTLVAVWAATGPMFDYSETWQLVINTGTTIITFLMVFLIQSSQNRDAKALHLKLDELIRSSKARNVFADLENANEHELQEFQREFEQLRSRGLRHNEAMIEAHRNVLGTEEQEEGEQ